MVSMLLLFLKLQLKVLVEVTLILHLIENTSFIKYFIVSVEDFG